MQLHYIEQDGTVLRLKTQNFCKDLKKSEDIFNFYHLDENNELFSNKNKKVFGKFKIETPKGIIIDDFIALRNKMYVYECWDDSKNEIKGISKSYSKIIIFEEYKKRIDGETCQEECEKKIF